MNLHDRYAKLYLGVVYDALRFDIKLDRAFVVHRDVKPTYALAPGEVLFGPAFTCRGARVLEPEHIDDTVRIKMFREFRPGCVQVIDCGGDESVAHFGDISGKLARKFGAVGAVIDGYTRDARIIEEDRFPVFCKGTQPTDAYGRWQIVGYQEPVTLPGPEGAIRVSPGDFLFGDPDGVLVIPHALGERVCELAEARVTRENLVRRELVATDDIQALYDKIGRW
ncbi:MAG TPA: RraA family protein [Polyangia bacterium]|jgi:regulator of RNase E activity RraA|nr:RraA family protein [Polyangia bacterium]